MKKIVFVHLYNDRSGSPKVLSQVIQTAREKGALTDILTSNNIDGFLTNSADHHIPIFYKRSESKLITLFYYILSQINLFYTCLRYKHEDVTFYINTMMPAGAAIAAKITKKPIIYHIHETSIKPKPLKLALRAVIRMTANKVIFVSNHLLKTEAFDGKRMVVVHNAPDITTHNSRPNHTPFNVLMACSLKKYKGIFEFLLIAKTFAATENIQFNLVLNASSDEIKNYLKGIEIPKNVHIHPRQADMSAFYEETHLVLNLSRPDEWIETFGLTIIEAMSTGIPVIAPPIGGPAEIVQDGKNGFLISCYDIDKISTIIKMLNKNNEQYKLLSNNALARSKDFNLHNFKHKISSELEI